jgi:hypothetical protein
MPPESVADIILRKTSRAFGVRDIAAFLGIIVFVVVVFCRRCE